MRLKICEIAVRELRFIESSDRAMHTFVADAIVTTGLTTSLVLWSDEADGHVAVTCSAGCREPGVTELLPKPM
jgi:hypothetical protein